MANQKGPPPAPLHPHVVNKLLDLLSTDDDFRDLFQRDAHAALVHWKQGTAACVHLGIAQRAKSAFAAVGLSAP